MLSYSKDDITRILGEEARDVNGKSVGFVDLVFVDDETGRPEWMGVWNGLPGSHRHLVPLRGVEEQGSELRVPWTKDVVKSAPTGSTSRTRRNSPRTSTTDSSRSRPSRRASSACAPWS